MGKLKNLASAPSVTAYLDPSDFLAALYRAAKASEESYSYLAFADDLGFSLTNVIHLIIRGKRPLTVRGGERIAEAMGWKGLERRYWLDMVAFRVSEDEAERDALMTEMLEIKDRELSRTPLLQNQLEFFSEWYHSVIYEVASQPGFNGDPKTLAAQLEPRIRPEQAKRSLELLVELGLLVRHEGRLTPLQKTVTTGDEIASLAVVRYHQNMIDLGKRSLTMLSAEQRDVSSISFACDESLAQDVKREISQFRKKILALSEKQKDGDCVYQLNLQLFPVARSKGKEK